MHQDYFLWERKYVCVLILLYKSTSNFFFTDEAEDDDANKEYIEEANRDAVMIAAAKLVANDKVSKVKLACVVYVLNGKFHPVRLESCVVWQVVLCYPSI